MDSESPKENEASQKNPKPDHFAWVPADPNAFERHRATKHISTGAYFAVRSKQLDRDLSEKNILYLDTCHWINLRHVIMKDSRERPGYREILAVLEKLKAQQSICCPISLWLFEELMKQSDLNTRLATARLMDRFSDGVCFKFPPEILRVELRRFLLGRVKTSKTVPDPGTVWTKCGFFAGELLPTIPNMTAEENCLIQKAWIDEMWATRLEHFLTMPESISFPDSSWQRYAEASNADAVAYRSARLPYKEVLQREKALLFRREVANEVEAVSREIWDAIPEVRDPLNQIPATEGDYSPWNMPSFQILAGISAANMVSNIKLNLNDMLDFHHAALAIPYCDALLCDNPMATRLRNKPCEFGKIYGTRILGRAEEIRTFLRELCG